MSEFEFTSRYDVFGPPNGCKGDCEGTGWVPHYERSGDTRPDSAIHGVRMSGDPDSKPIYRALWALAERDHPSEDGTHFLPCPECKPEHPLVKEALAR